MYQYVNSDLFLNLNPDINLLPDEGSILFVVQLTFAPQLTCFSDFSRLWETANRCCREEWQLPFGLLGFMTLGKRTRALWLLNTDGSNGFLYSGTVPVFGLLKCLKGKLCFVYFSRNLCTW
ncbi:hypothetical protein D3C74_331150 [compost metagenome]